MHSQYAVASATYAYLSLVKPPRTREGGKGANDYSPRDIISVIIHKIHYRDKKI